MNIFTSKAVLMCGVAAVATLCTASAWAQGAGGADVETVTVTGTSIRGAAPVGSNLVTVGRDEMEKSAAISASEITDTIPAITQAFSAAQGENTYSYYEPSIHGLGGSASATTLVIVDGLRMPGGGTQFDQKDPNIIPSSALQRVEVLADGASSVYGSDAVAGVVNYITRTSYDGLEVNGRVGVADQWDSHDLNAIWGTSWNTGGVYVAGQYAFQTSLANNARSFLDKGNYLPQGQNLDTFNCSPATIRTPASGSNVYVSPSSTTTIANVSTNSPCNNTTFGDVLPSSDRKNGLARVTQSLFNDRLVLTGTADYSFIQAHRHQQQGLITGIAADGPGSGAGGQINPFYQAPAGQPTATTETISWAALEPGNNYGLGTTSNDTIFLYGNAEYKIDDEWTAKLSNAFGRSRSNSAVNNAFCTSCAYLALNGTTQTNGSTTTSSIAGANIIALNTPLTTSNALDVWNANGGNTSASVLKSLYSLNTNTTHWNEYDQTKFEVQGPVMTLPAGELKVAGGVEYMWLTQNVETMATGGLGATNGLVDYFVYGLARNVYSGYVEANAPIVSEEMNIPLVKKLDIDISGRYDHYSDVGVTSNPKFAANWEVTDGVRLRANYATAFVAPPLNAIGIPSAGYRRGISGASVDTTSLVVPVSLYPQITSIPGCTGVTTTCTIGGSTAVQGLTRSYGVGANAKNETGNSWSAGLDFSPTFLPGFSSSFTFWSNRYKNGVDSLGITYQIDIPALNRLVLCPATCSTAQINNFTNIANGGTLSGTLPSTVYFLRNQDLGNVVNLHVQGVDFEGQYAMETETAGNFTLGLTGTWFTRFDQDYPGLTFSILGTSGSNQTYPSVQGHARLHGGWDMGPFSLDAFVNYTTAYHNWSNTALNPVITGSNGALLGGGDKVSANTTLDLHAEYSFSGDMGWFGDKTSVYLDGKNVLDTTPPFYSGNTTGIAVGGNGYNGFVSDPIGRIMSIGFRADY